MYSGRINSGIQEGLAVPAPIVALVSVTFVSSPIISRD
jgi:hypothetical protein